MITQILVTLELDPDATTYNLGPSCQPPTRKLLLDDLNTVLRQWALTNPYELRDPDNLNLKLELAEAREPGRANLRGKLRVDLENIANDLNTLARLCREAV
ncbi:MAG: hypothetical protein MUF81_06675 [Verrucomicrobia bacterium]|jgi:hypothetical protein|nr:hypothetical protein [Verrucomicrobiota bacterium]